jgi:hypothetical protein
MNATILQKRDFWAGALYVAFGLATFLIGQNYAMGTVARMGAGYFPTILGIVLAFIGALSVVRSFLTTGDEVGRILWKPAALIGGSTILFAALLERAGLVVSLIVLVLVSAAGSRSFRLDAKAGLGLVVFVAICALVFVKGLGVPMPLLGSWFGE